MTRHLLLFFLLFFLACKEEQKRNVIQSNSKDSLTLDTSFIRALGDSPLDLFISEYSDSLNNYTSNAALPEFLKNYYFDYDHVGLFSPVHAPMSLRKLILDKVNNCEVLIAILSEENSIYNKKPGKRGGIKADLSELSFADLAKVRQAELGCK